MIEQIKEKCQHDMSSVLDSLKLNLQKMRTGKASVSLLDSLKVDSYGSLVPISQVGQISTPEARLLQIRPFDKSQIPAIEKAIINSHLGVTPSNDGQLIRLPFPALTEEKRKDLVKELKSKAEDARVVIRNIRREQNEVIKKLEKDKDIGEDQSKKWQTEVQTLTDKFIKDVDAIIAIKEKDLMTI